jgi:type I restriction enzyme M protein
MSINILKYESEVWKTADLLIGAGIKQSDFPKYMMPFFALIMVESRMIREADRLEKEVGRDDIEDFIEMFNLEGLGYNDLVIRKKKTLKDICKNDKSFDVDFHSYLKAFDGETKYLLGVDKGTEEEKFLDISGIAGQLKKKRILFDTVKAWSEIDLTPFNNSEITTLEEHIKRKWADISAETAGEQYTPDDIISLISEIIATKIEDNGKFLTIYDPTCGGGNLLFGVEDKIQEIYPNRPTATYGQEWNGTLFALAKIESRFRKDTAIEYGNTLTDIGKFWDKTFNIVVANPPYGVDWKGYEKDIKNDTTERFVALPSISDGQFLFTQHILHKLADDGMSIVVHNGSTLFSGDAGSGESNIRKHFFEKDWVEAIIQMPTDEFFNTGIYTYLWIFNKDKPADRKDKIILINASELNIPLKKSKGKKRKEMDLPNRTKIVQALTEFKDNEFSKVFDKWHFYFNRQSIMLTNIDENGKAIEMPIKVSKDGEEKEEKAIKLTPTKITQTDDENPIEITEFDITTFDKTKYSSLENYFETGIKPQLAELDYKEKNLTLFTKDASYYYDADKETLIVQTKKEKAELGCGKIVIKAILKKDSKTKKAKSISITAELTKDLQKDFEIIPYNPIEAINQKNIADFMAKYVFKPFEYLDSVIGVEINFNKLFTLKTDLVNSVTVIDELKELQLIYSAISSDIIQINFSINDQLTTCDIERIDTMPMAWYKNRLKDIGFLYSGISGKKGDDFNNDNDVNNKGFIPFTNIANNTYIKQFELGTVIILPTEKQNKVKQYDLFFLMSSEGYADVGKSSLLIDVLTDDTYLNSFCKGFRITSNNISPKFLNYLLLSNEFREKIILEGKGFTRINLKMEKISDLEFYYPSNVGAQNKIETFLDNRLGVIDIAIENLTKQIETYKNLRKSLINDATNGKIIIK